MKRRIFSIFFALVLALSLSLVTAVPAAALTDRLVPSSYNTIQAAIDAAAPGDTIIVSDGTYDESISVTTADLTLRSENGQDSTIIENVGSVTSPEAATCGFLIRGPANNFTLGGAPDQGFTFSGGTAPRLIQLNNSPSGVEISYNTVNTTGDANTGILIGAAGATGLTVDYNIFIADEDGTYQDWPLIGPDTTNPVLDVTVTGNEFTGSGTPGKYGAAICLGKIGVSSLTESTIADNTISAFDRGIIISADSADLDVSGNTISDCDKGVQFRTGTHAEMENNTFANNTYNIYHAAEILTGGSSFYGNIQDAIDAASSGDAILVYAGTYTEDLTVNTANLTLQSETGKANTTIQLVDGVGIDIQAGATNFTLGGASGEGFTILSGSTTTFNIQVVNAPSDVEISYNTVNTTGSASQGISVGAAGATDLTIIYNDFIAEVGDISIFGPDVVNVKVEDNTFTGPSNTTNGVAVEFVGVTGTSTIAGNRIAGYGSGIFVFGASQAAQAGTTGVSGLTISDNPISGCAKGIRLGYSDQSEVMDVVTVEDNTLSSNTVGLYVSDGANVLADEFVISSNSFLENTSFGLENLNTLDVTAECNYWGSANGPTHASNLGGTGDPVSDDVDYHPWLLEAGGSCVDFDQAQALNVGWTLVSTDNWIDTDNTTWVGVMLALKYTAGSGYTSATVLDLEPVNALYLKTVGGGGIAITYSGGVPVASSKDLEAGWNLISSATKTNDARAVLSPLRYIDVGEEQGVGMATLVGQGRYNRYTGDFYLATTVSYDWVVLMGTDLSPFDGYWVYMNAGKNFGVIPQ